MDILYGHNRFSFVTPGLAHFAGRFGGLSSHGNPFESVTRQCGLRSRFGENTWLRLIDSRRRGSSPNAITRCYDFRSNAPEELIEITQGEIEGITENNLRTILKRLEVSYAEDKAKEIEALRLDQERIKTDLAEAHLTVQEREALLTEAAAREQALLNETGAKEREIERLRSVEAASVAKEQRLKEKIDRISDRIATIAYAVSWVIFAVFAILACLQQWNPWLSIPAAVVGVLNIAAGFSGPKIRRFVRNKVAANLSHLRNRQSSQRISG